MILEDQKLQVWLFSRLSFFILGKFGNSSELKFSKIKIQSLWKSQDGNFPDSGFAKNWFHTKYEWQNNSEISTLCSFHLNDFVFQEGNWVWESSGVPFTFTNWASGEPNGSEDDCLVIYRGNKKWYDDNCENTTYYKPLCQIDAWK